MLEKGLQLERELFFSLNGSSSIFLDNFFYICTNPWTWLLFYLCYFWVIVYKKNWKDIVYILAAIGLLILLTDQISSGFFKPFFQRFRPTHHPDFMNDVKIVFNYRGGNYGFISGHATNSFGLATFSALIFRNKLFTFTVFIYAILLAYSRIYIGVHFISDVVVGALVGSLLGILVYLLYNWARRRWLSMNKEQLKKPVCFKRETYFLCAIFYLYLVIIMIFNNQFITIILSK